MLEFLHERDFLRVFLVFLPKKAASECWLLINAESKADHVVCELRALYLISHAGLNPHSKSSSAGELSMSIERLELSRLSAREPKSRASAKFRHMDKYIKSQ